MVYPSLDSPDIPNWIIRICERGILSVRRTGQHGEGAVRTGRRPAVTRRVPRLGRTNPLARLHAWFLTIGPSWWTSSVNFKSARSQVITVGKSRWRVDFSLYGVRWGWTGASQIRYDSTISVSPWRVPVTEKGRLARSGWYEEVTSKCRRLGYRGTWHRVPDGKMGIFQKRLADLDAVKAEVSRLAELRI